jgi:hypothetical protein
LGDARPHDLGGEQPVNISSDELHTLQLGPLWVLSAMAGRCSRFDTDELAAFWDTVVAVALRTPEPARQLLTSISIDRSGLMLDFELDDRPVVSGLGQVLAVLDKLSASVGTDYRLALVNIAIGLGRARGPYGRRTSPEDEQMILLIAALLEIESAPGLPDEVLV